MYANRFLLPIFQLKRSLELISIKDSYWDPFDRVQTSVRCSKQHEDLVEKAKHLDKEETRYCYFIDSLKTKNDCFINLNSVSLIGFCRLHIEDSQEDTYGELFCPENKFHVFKDGYDTLSINDLFAVEYTNVYSPGQVCYAVTRKRSVESIFGNDYFLSEERIIKGSRIATTFINNTKTLFKDLPEELVV